MPLLPSNIARNFDEARKMVGLWMRDPNVVGPLHGVRVFVTLEALWTLDPLSLRDVPAALAICEEQRGKIHLAASRKFDYSGPEQGEAHELPGRSEALSRVGRPRSGNRRSGGPPFRGRHYLSRFSASGPRLPAPSY